MASAASGSESYSVEVEARLEERGRKPCDKSHSKVPAVTGGQSCGPCSEEFATLLMRSEQLALGLGRLEPRGSLGSDQHTGPYGGRRCPPTHLIGPDGGAAPWPATPTLEPRARVEKEPFLGSLCDREPVPVFPTSPSPWGKQPG